MNKKVLHVVSVSFSLKYFIGNQFKYFRDRGWNFTVACSPSDNLFSYAKEMQFATFPVKIRRNISPIQDIISIYHLYKFIKREEFDLVIAHSPKGGLIGMIAAYFAGTPKRIFFRHGLVFETAKGLKRKLLVLIEKIIGYCSSKIVNVSKSIENESIKFSLNLATKNIILGKGTCNGVDVQKFIHRPKETYKDKFVVGFIGRLTKDKGINELIQCMDLLENYSDILFLLVGPIDEREGLDVKILSKLNSNPKIKYLGAVQNAEPYYNQMDVFILPSYREGFPTVNLEASSSALPVITTKVTGCIDSIIEGQTGLFCEHTPLSIAEKILVYYNNRNLALEHGRRGRQFVEENFSEALVYKEIENRILN